MYGRVPEPWWLRSAAPIVTQTNQIYVHMQIVRGRLWEIYVYVVVGISNSVLSILTSNFPVRIEKKKFV